MLDINLIAERKAPTLMEVKKAADFAKTCLGRPAAVKLIHSFGVTTLAELDAINYEEFIDACNAAVYQRKP